MPRGIAFDQQGNVYITDFGNRTQVFSEDGTFLRQWGTYGTGNGQFYLPAGILIHNNRVYVTDMGNNRVQVFTLSGNYITQWDTGFVLGDTPSGPDVPFMPVSICVNSSGYFYIGGNGGIKVYSPQMTYITSIGSFGDGDDQFVTPTGLAFNSTGFLYASDPFCVRFTVISPDNQIVATFGTPTAPGGDINLPWGLAIDAQDLLYVASWENRIVVRDPSGNVITTWGTEGSGPGQFEVPTGIGILGSQKGGASSALRYIYVTDTYNDRIQAFIARPPVADFSASPTSGTGPLTVLFSDSSSGTVSSYSWDFGDGSTSSSPNPVHTYVQSGKYTVTLTVSNAAGYNTLVKKNYIAVAEKSTQNCGTLYIGQTYDVSGCVSPGSMIGWWASSSDKYKDGPTQMVIITDPESFYVSPTMFSGLTGTWYILDPSTGLATDKAFKIEDPKKK
jgi:tripartite motif-containing protein 71